MRWFFLSCALFLATGNFVTTDSSVVHAAGMDKTCVILNESSCQNNVGLPGATIECGCVRRYISASESCASNEILFENIPSDKRCNFNYTVNGPVQPTGGNVSFLSVAPKLQIPIPGFKGFTQILKPVCEQQAATDTVDYSDAAIASDAPPDDDALADLNDSANPTNICDTPYLSVPYIAEYFSGVYVFLIGAAAILAGIMITIGGLQWLLAAGEAPKIQAAKKRIGNAIVGLVLTLGSYTVLYTINPELVTMKAIRIKLVNREDITIAASTDQCSNAPGMLPIPTGSGLIGTNQRTTAQNLERLLVVSRILEDQYGISMRVASGARKMSTQLDLIQKRGMWDAQSRNYVRKPGNVQTLSRPQWWLGPNQPNPEYYNACVHVNSLDIYAGAPGTSWKSTEGVVIKNTAPAEFAGKTCLGCGGSINSKQTRICWATDPCQQALIHEMTKTGFTVLMQPSACSGSFEPWHFNLPTTTRQSGTLDSNQWRSAATRAQTAAQNGYRCN